METLRYTVKMLSLSDIWHILFLGDIHLGNPGCDVRKLQQSIDKIRDDQYYITVGMGDYAENNNSSNERSLGTFDPEMMLKSKAPLLSQQIRAIRALWQPITRKTIGMHIGNHEDRTMLHDEFKLNITEPLGVNYLGDKAYIALDFVFEGKLIHQYKLITAHSRFGGQFDGTVAMAAERAYNAYEDFDAIAFGHTHYSFAQKKFRKFLDTSGQKPEIKLKKYYILNTGTFLNAEVEGYDAYTDRKLGGGIREPGTVTLSFHPEKGELYAHT